MTRPCEMEVDSQRSKSRLEVHSELRVSCRHGATAAVAQELEEVFRMEDKRVDSLWGYEHFIIFADRWAKKYPALRRYRTERSIAYFTYMDFPEQVQRCIYTTNWIERLNRKYKRVVKMRNAMPSAQAVIFLLGTIAKMETEYAYARRLYQFRCWTGMKTETIKSKDREE